MSKYEMNSKHSEDVEQTVSVGGDEALLAQMGHTQELERDFSFLSLGCLCLCLMATWEALCTVMALGLTTGGAPVLLYNYFISFICSVAVAASLGEIASVYPTAGGQYHWVAVLASPSTKAVASWFAGWVSIGGQIVLTASAAFAAGLQFQALITVNHVDSYIPQRWQGMLFYWAVILYSVAINIWGVRMLPTANLASGVLHILGFAGIFATLWAVQKGEYHSASYVFTEFVNTSGYSSNGIAWCVGLISTVYPFLGYDAAAHLSEEIPNPTRNVPLAMVLSVVANGVMGLAFVFTLLFCLGDLEPLLESPTGFPFIQLFVNATGSKAGATIMTLVITLIATAASAAGVTSTSRTLWAFARDDATPFAGWLAKVHPGLKVPIPAIAIVGGLQMLLGFVYLGSTTAFNAVLSMAIVGMYVSYILPIAYWLFGGRSRTHKTHGDQFAFSLGKKAWQGAAVNVVALAWLCFATLFSLFPSYAPVNPTNMNYAVVVMGGWTVCGFVYYFLSGVRKRYSGPVDILGGEKEGM